MKTKSKTKAEGTYMEPINRIPCSIATRTPTMVDHTDDHLALAMRHIIEGELRVTQQAARVAKLAAAGCDTTNAKVFLETLIYGLALMSKHLQMILDERVDRTP
jgi:hypothetical protein